MDGLTVVTGGVVAEVLRGLAARDAFIEANASRWDVTRVLLGHGAYALVSEGRERRMIVARGRDHGIPRLLAGGAAAIGEIGFALVSYDAEGAVPVIEREFGLSPAGDWVWLYTRDEPPAVDGDDLCGPLGPDAAGEIAALLTEANPSTSAAREAADLTWWGYRDETGRLLSACGLRLPLAPADGVHLSGFGTHPDARGRGIGTAMMAAMTRWGVRTHGLVHYGVWSDNSGALRIYGRLGYRQAAHLRNYTSPHPAQFE